MRFRDFSPIERQTAVLLLWAALFNGVVVSLGQIQDIIARKALLATDWQLALMTMIWPIANFFSIWWGRMFERSCHKSRHILIAGVFGRLVLAYGVWLTTMNEFLVLLTVMFAFNSLLIPAQNLIYQKNINPGRRGKVYGYTISLSMVITITVTFLAGKWLDMDEAMFRWLLVGTGICGFISCFLLSMIRVQTPILEPSCGQVPWRRMISEPLRLSVDLLKRDKAFACFERSFTIYGMGFIMMTPVLPIYLVDVMQLSYTTNFLVKGVLSQAGLLLLSSYLGKLHDRLHPFRFISLAFGMLALFPLLILTSAYFVRHEWLGVFFVFAAFTVFGIAMSGINMAWNMSSIYFAGVNNAAMYQSVHVTLTGFRGLLAPVIGFALLRTLGINSVFAVAIGFLVTASIISWYDHRRLLANAVNHNN